MRHFCQWACHQCYPHRPTDHLSHPSRHNLCDFLDLADVWKTSHHGWWGPSGCHGSNWRDALVVQLSRSTEWKLSAVLPEKHWSEMGGSGREMKSPIFLWWPLEVQTQMCTRRQVTKFLASEDLENQLGPALGLANWIEHASSVQGEWTNISRQIQEISWVQSRRWDKCMIVQLSNFSFQTHCCISLKWQEGTSLAVPCLDWPSNAGDSGSILVGKVDPTCLLVTKPKTLKKKKKKKKIM